MNRDERDRRRRIPVLVTGVAVSGFVFGLYLRTLAPTVLGFEPPVVFDSAMLQAGAYTLGIAHPTGYSTYMMLTHLFTHLPFGDVAYRVNLASAVFGAVAVFLVYLVALRLSRSIAAAALGALAFGISGTYWSQAVISEVYTLNALLIAAVLLTILVWRDTRREGLLLLAFFLAGLSLTHHLTSALLIPAGIGFFLLCGDRKPPLRKFVPKGIGLLLLGLTPYLYFPVRALMDAPLNESDPSTPGRFLLLVTGGGFVFRGSEGSEISRPETSTTDVITTRLTDYSGYIGDQFPLLLAAVGVAGVFILLRKDGAGAVLLGVPFVGSLLHGLVYGYEDYFLFLIPAYLVFGVCISLGAVWISETIRHLLSGRMAAVAASGVSVVLFVVCLAGIPRTFSEQDRSEDFTGRRTIEAVVEYAEPGATVLHHRSSLWYMALVEGRRGDLTLVDPYRTSFRRYTDIVWPDAIDSTGSARAYGTDDPTGVRTARMVSGDGAVYILGREVEAGTVDTGYFRDAGFRVVQVDDGGELYELVPQ